jgi:hypothetical protein
MEQVLVLATQSLFCKRLGSRTQSFARDWYLLLLRRVGNIELRLDPQPSVVGPVGH